MGRALDMFAQYVSIPFATCPPIRVEEMRRKEGQPWKKETGGDATFRTRSVHTTCGSTSIKITDTLGVE